VSVCGVLLAEIITRFYSQRIVEQALAFLGVSPGTAAPTLDASEQLKLAVWA
jgi:hypothetical protein